MRPNPQKAADVVTFNVEILKDTLMQIWKSLYMFVSKWKQYPEYFVFLILWVFELFTHKVCEMFIYKHTETKEYVER